MRSKNTVRRIQDFVILLALIALFTVGVVGIASALLSWGWPF